MARSSGILALPELSDGSPVEDGLNAATEPGSRFCLRLPDQLNRFHDKRHVDRLHLQVAEYGIGVQLQRRSPLRGMFLILPTNSMRSIYASAH